MHPLQFILGTLATSPPPALQSEAGLLDEAVVEAEELKEEEEHEELGQDLVLLSFSLVLLIVIAIWAEQRNVPSSAAAILVGSLLGLVLRVAGADAAPSLSMLHQMLFFNEEIFLYFLLPPIIFEAGFSLSRRTFFTNLATILLFAVVGTFLTTLVVGLGCQLAGSWGWFRSGRADALDFSNPKDAFTFGALISATDPVATLSIMGAANVDPMMYTLVSGESVLNDAVAIVLVRILNSLGPDAFEQPSAVLSGLLQFVSVSLGSLLVGLTIAACSAMMLKRVDLSHHASFELSLLLLIGYSAYPTSEAVHCSGILALFACSVFMGQYHVHNLSPEAGAAISIALKSLAHLAETFVFMYMGLDLIAQQGAVDDLFDEDLGTPGVEEARSTRGFVAFAVLLVPLARALVVPPLCLVANTCWRGRKRSLTLRETIFLVFAGLRGAIAFALARNAASRHRRTIVAATTAVIVFTTFVLGGLTRNVLRWLGMMAQPKEAQYHSAPKRDDGGEAGRRWEQLDARVFQPLFGAPKERGAGANELALDGREQALPAREPGRRCASSEAHIELQPLGPGVDLQLAGQDCQ